MSESRTTEVAGQLVYICDRCNQPILSVGVLTSGRVVHVPMCPIKPGPG